MFRPGVTLLQGWDGNPSSGLGRFDGADAWWSYVIHGLCGLADAKLHAHQLSGLWLTPALAWGIALALLTPRLDVPLVGWAMASILVAAMLQPLLLDAR